MSESKFLASEGALLPTQHPPHNSLLWTRTLSWDLRDHLCFLITSTLLYRDRVICHEGVCRFVKTRDYYNTFELLTSIPWKSLLILINNNAIIEISSHTVSKKRKVRLSKWTIMAHLYKVHVTAAVSHSPQSISSLREEPGQGIHEAFSHFDLDHKPCLPSLVSVLLPLWIHHGKEHVLYLPSSSL